MECVMFVRWIDKDGDDVIFDTDNVSSIRRKDRMLQAIDFNGRTISKAPFATVSDACMVMDKIMEAKKIVDDVVIDCQQIVEEIYEEAD